MKRFTFFLLLPVVLITCCSSVKLGDDAGTDEQILAAIVSQILESGHYGPYRLNDKISQRAHGLFLERLDFNKMYFLKEDINKLNKHRNTIDDELENLSLSFYYTAAEIIDKRMKEAEEICMSILDKPIELNQSGDFEIDPEKRDYFKNENARAEFWQNYLQYLTLNRLANRIEKQEKQKEKMSEAAEKVSSDEKDEEEEDEPFVEKTVEELEEAVRKQVRKNMKTRFKRRYDEDAEDRFARFVNAVANAFGPHTEYFPPQEKENFDMRMTGTLEGIGALLSQENGYIKVAEIVPGSASWRQGELKPNDLIIKVAQADGEPVDIVDATMKEAIKKIRGPKGTEVRLTVQKPDGEVKVIPIIRDVVVQEETYAKSALFKDKKSEDSYGYIYLPSFYSTFGKRFGRESAKDIEKELEMLKQKDVKGIILDLRNNGGGSLQDAIKMAGLFVKNGPIVQVKDEGQQPKVYSDYNPGITYDGHLVILVNSFSASASEILAGALKDYKRAVIVGTQTFGKGTVQSFVDLNRYTKPNARPTQPLGSLKLTIQQYYRVNGASTQLKGVKPNIYLPDEYSYLETGIRTLDYPLAWDSIRTADYKEWKTGIAYNKLKKSSAKRIGNNPYFKLLQERNEYYKEDRDNTLEPLSLAKEQEQRRERKELNKKYEEIRHANEDFTVESLQVFKPEEEADVVEEKKERWEKDLSKDIYIQEAIDIIKDMSN